MPAPLDKAALLEFVENAHEGDGLDFQDIGKPALMDALVAAEIGERLPMRARQAMAARALLKPLAQQASDVMQEKTEGGSIVHGATFPNS